MNKLWIVLVVCVVTFLAGLALGYQLFSGKVKIVEKDKPAVVLHDSSLIIQRVRDTVLIDKMVFVKGLNIVHEGSISVAPTQKDTIVDTLRLGGDTVVIVKTIGFDTVNITYRILQEKSGGLRVQIKANGGTIIGAVDIPKESLIMGKDLKNTIGLCRTFAPRDGVSNIGLFYNRGVGPFVIGPTIQTKVNQWDNISIGINAGIRW